VTAASLKGRLLIALPVLTDPNFDRTIVFMLEHSDEGAVGVVVNRPSPLTVAEPLPSWVALATEPRVVFVGGPVSPSSAIGLIERDDQITTVDLEAEPDEGDLASEARVRVFAGYAGWGAGQLEDEIAAGAWVVVDAMAGDVMTDDPEELWSYVLRRQGGRLAAVADFPRDPTLN
jgi:putative transcriptional regulator